MILEALDSFKASVFLRPCQKKSIKLRSKWLIDEHPEMIAKVIVSFRSNRKKD